MSRSGQRQPLLIAPSPRGLLSAMNQPPRPARRCRCERPVLDGESCLLCGRPLKSLPETRGAPRRPVRKDPWTHQGVIRAIRAFAFFRGRAPVQADWNGRMAEDWPRLETVLGLFGSVEQATQAAGIDPQAVGRARAAGE